MTFRKLLPPYSPSLGLQLMRVGKLQLWLERLPEAGSSIKQVGWVVDIYWYKLLLLLLY